jgi:adenine-specific DNA-methyltransferase
MGGGGSEDTPVEQQIALFADNLRPGRSTEDILTEILLKSGYELTVPVARLQLAGKDVFSVADGALLVCLDRALTIEVIEAMAALDPAQIICLDLGFGGNDALKVNAVQTIRARNRRPGQNTVFKVV